MSTTTYTLQYASTLANFATVTITDPSIAVAQTMAANAATAVGHSIILTSSALPGQSWTYNPGATPVGYWRSTYNEIFSTLGASSTLGAQESALGQTIAAALLSAGNAYDVASAAGVKNGSVYALQRNAWASVLAEPAWLELDRVCRYVYSSIATNLAVAQAAFGGTAPGWQAGTQYGQGGVVSFVTPSPVNGYCYATQNYVGVFKTAGTSGSTQPAFPAGPIGAEVGDGSTLLWACIAATVSPAGAALPFDQTLAAQQTLLARYSAASQIASGSAPLQAMLSDAYSAWATALAARPTINATAETASTTATTNLNVALANAQTWIAAATFQ